MRPTIADANRPSYVPRRCKRRLRLQRAPPQPSPGPKPRPGGRGLGSSKISIFGSKNFFSPNLPPPTHGSHHPSYGTAGHAEGCTSLVFVHFSCTFPYKRPKLPWRPSKTTPEFLRRKPPFSGSASPPALPIKFFRTPPRHAAKLCTTLPAVGNRPKLAQLLYFSRTTATSFERRLFSSADPEIFQKR